MVSGARATGADKAIGFLSSGTFASPDSIVLGITNNTGLALSSLTLNWNDEKYRSGSRAFNWTMGYSTNGGSSYTLVPAGAQSYAADANNTTVSDPPTQIAKTVTITGLNIANGSSLDFEWIYTGVGGSTNGQALAIDDFSLTFTAVPEPATVVGGFVAACGLLINQRRRLLRFLGSPAH